MTKIAELLGIDLPIIQAPMAGAQGSAMAIAVSNAGGLGSLPAAMLTADGLRREMESIKQKTDRPINVNFFCHTAPVADAARDSAYRSMLTRYYEQYGVDPEAIPAGPRRAPFCDELADVLEQYQPAVVSFHFGLPDARLMARLKAWRSLIFCSATTIEEALWLAARGADVIIAQGAEAGGHRGMFLTDDLTTQVGTFALLPQIVRAVKVPVVAAGGIADAQGVAAAMALGASGVQIGTAYLLCQESDITAPHRAALASNAARHTALTNLFTGRPARGIVNRLMREIGPINNHVPAFPLAATAIAPLRASAESQGSCDFSPLWCGQNATGCKAIPAAQLTRELWTDGPS